MENNQPLQLLLFKKIIKSDFLEAKSPRKAFYNLFLETNGFNFFIRKQSGCSGSKALNEISWKFKNKLDALKKYKLTLKEKTNAHRKSTRIYKRLKNK